MTFVAAVQRGNDCSSVMALLLHNLGFLFLSLTREAAGEQLLHLYSMHRNICKANSKLFLWSKLYSHLLLPLLGEGSSI